jgi:hypothetical protein
MSKELHEHLTYLARWIEEQGNIPTPDPELSAEERKQLLAVNKAIEQLTRLGVSVPEDLRKLKLRLSTKGGSGTENREIEERTAKVEVLIEQLRKVLRAARSLRDRLKATGQTPGTKRHYGVTVLELLQSEDLSTEDALELQWMKDGPIFEGKIQQDGSVTVRTPSGWKRYDALSTAASQIADRSLNGWDHWRRVNRDGTRTALKEIRARYLKEGGRS